MGRVMKAAMTRWLAGLGLALGAGCAPEREVVGLGDTDAPKVEDRTCGDGDVAPWEACDLGAQNGPGAPCKADCTLAMTQELAADPALDARWLLVRDARGAAGQAAGGRGAWGSAGRDANEDGVVQFEVRVSVADPAWPLLGGIPLADVASIAVHTWQERVVAPTRFELVVFTSADGADDAPSWYGRRLVARLATARDPRERSGSWTRWATGSGPSQLTFLDEAAAGRLPGDGLALPTLGELVAAPWSWAEVVEAPVSSTPIDYGGERLLALSVVVAPGPASATWDGLVDLLEVELVDGRVLVVDLEP